MMLGLECGVGMKFYLGTPHTICEALGTPIHVKLEDDIEDDIN
jgi:hypothetical protein